MASASRLRTFRQGSLDVFPIPGGIYFGRKNYSPVARLHSRTTAEFKLEI